jgi:hypothetical protein
MSVSLICACKNRIESLKISLSSWLLFEEITEIVIVDWDSDESFDHLVSLDSKIKIIKVSNEKYFNQPQPLNLAFSVTTGDYILKVDTDYVLNPYYNFFDFYKIDKNSFLCGQTYHTETEIISIPYFSYLRGLLYVSRENYLKVGGYNETNTKHYAYEDDEIVFRLEKIGLEKKKIFYNHNIIHLPHSDKKRLENFEAYQTDKELEIYIRNNLSSYYSGEELQWQVEYALSEQHIEISRQKYYSQTNKSVFESNTKWKVFEQRQQIYRAIKVEKENKLLNFPKTYYITLEESIDRQLSLESKFEEYGIKPKAIISKRFFESDDIVTGKYLNQLNDGTKGCCISHLKAIKQWYENCEDDEYGFFCEDDLSLETVKYWDFTWQDFMNSLPDDWDAVQLLTIRENFDTFSIRERYWDDWSVTAYILNKDYAKKIIDTYIIGDAYNLEIPNSSVMPLIENIIFTTFAKSYTVPIFVEDVDFKSTFSEKQDDDVNNGQKKNHYIANNIVLNYWKNKIVKNNNQINFNIKMNLQDLLTTFSLDTENPINNFNLGFWYETNGHTSPAFSYYLRCAERSEDLDLAYEALIRGSYCHEKQGIRDGTVKTLLQQALCILPKRPEAYFILSRFSESRQSWQDCYIYADWGIQFANFNLKPLLTDVEYPGYCGLLFEKAISGWWWGKNEESKNILLDLKNNYTLDEQYQKSVEENLTKLGIDFNQNKLSEIFNIEKHNTDKNDLGYLDNFYDDLFLVFKDSPIKMMEIGVYNGGSIKLWKEYLHKESKIYACDINYFEHIDGTFSIIGDMYNDNQVSKFSDDYFDLIIDDGPHTFESFVLVMQKYFSKLKKGGVLVIEDIINTNWAKPLCDLSYSLGYFNCEIIDMRGKQKTQELFDRWTENGLCILKIIK